MKVSQNNSFDALRLFAALQVVFMHSYAHLKLHGTFGNTLFFDILAAFPGVPVFFVMSGYLIAQSYERSSCARIFFIKRVSRIYPALTINILVIEIFVIMFGQHRYSESGFWGLVIYELIYIVTASSDIAHAIAPVSYMKPIGHFFARYPSGVLWTLTVELSFYLAAPLLLFLTKNHGVRRRVGICFITILAIASFIFSLFYVDDIREKYPVFDNYYSITFLPYFWMFAIGILMSFSANWPKSFFSTFILLGFLLVIMLAVLPQVRGGSWLYWKDKTDLCSLLQVVLLGIFTIMLGRTSLLNFNGAIKVDVSYGIYLWHMFAISILMNTSAVGNPLSMLVVIFLSVPIAYFSWNIVEVPAMNMGRRFAVKNGFVKLNLGANSETDSARLG